MSKVVKITIPNEFGYEVIPRLAAERLGHTIRFQDERIEDIGFLVSEAATSAIEYGHRSDVDITFLVEAETLTIKVVDIGPRPPLYLPGDGLPPITIYHILDLADKAQITPTPEGYEVEIMFYLNRPSEQIGSKHQIIQKAQGYWNTGDFLETGMVLFERIPRKLRPVWSTRLLEAVYEYGPRSKEIDAVIDLGRKPDEWIDRQREANEIVRAVNVLHSVEEEPLPKAIFTLAKNVGKVIYNAYGFPALFDHSAGWQIAGDFKRIVDLVDNPDFTANAWSILCDEELIELATPIECSHGCPVCHTLFEVESSGILVGMGENQITVEKFFEVTGFSRESIE